MLIGLLCMLRKRTIPICRTGRRQSKAKTMKGLEAIWLTNTQIHNLPAQTREKQAGTTKINAEEIETKVAKQSEPKPKNKWTKERNNENNKTKSRREGGTEIARYKHSRSAPHPQHKARANSTWWDVSIGVFTRAPILTEQPPVVHDAGPSLVAAAIACLVAASFTLVYHLTPLHRLCGPSVPLDMELREVIHDTAGGKIPHRVGTSSYVCQIALHFFAKNYFSPF